MRGLTLRSTAMIAALLAAAAFARVDVASADPAATGERATDAPAWHQTFTFRGDLDTADARSLVSDELLEFNAGEKWGFTLGFDGLHRDAIDLEGMRAGAFYNFTPRFRFGGELSFTGPEEGLVPGEPATRDAPEIKLESAFRF